MRKWHLAASFAALAACATHAGAQQIDSPYRFVDPGQQANVYVGYIATDPGASDLGPESAMTYGVRYGIRVSGPFSIEIAAGVLPTTRAVQDTAISATDTTIVDTGLDADITLGIATADLRFDITGPRTWHGLMPFALLGIGGAFVLSEDDDADASVEPDVRYTFGTRLMGDLGVGVEWFPVERLTLRLDARNQLWQIDAPRALRLLDTPSTEWVQNFLLSAGVSFRF